MHHSSTSEKRQWEIFIGVVWVRSCGHAGYCTADTDRLRIAGPDLPRGGGGADCPGAQKTQL